MPRRIRLRRLPEPRDLGQPLIDPAPSGVGDQAGFAGRKPKQLTDALGLHLLRPDREDETYRHGNLGGVRQWIESVNQTLKDHRRQAQ